MNMKKSREKRHPLDLTRCQSHLIWVVKPDFVKAKRVPCEAVIAFMDSEQCSVSHLYLKSLKRVQNQY